MICINIHVHGGCHLFFFRITTIPFFQITYCMRQSGVFFTQRSGKPVKFPHLIKDSAADPVFCKSAEEDTLGRIESFRRVDQSHQGRTHDVVPGHERWYLGNHSFNHLLNHGEVVLDQNRFVIVRSRCVETVACIHCFVPLPIARRLFQKN